MEFCYGDLEAGDDSSSGDEKKKKKKTNASYAGVKKQKKTVKFDWIPPNVSKTLVSERECAQRDSYCVLRPGIDCSNS
jgi:hypothetical protein